MNALLKYSEAELHVWEEEIKTICQKLLTSENLLTKELLLTEPEVCTILGVSDRTMRTYRKQHYFHSIKLEGRILYIKVIFLQDLLFHNR